MKLIRFGAPGVEKPGLLAPDGARVDASAFGEDWDEAFFGSDGLARLVPWAEGNLESAPRVPEGERLGPPVGRPSKIICIGLNYADHAKESGIALPKEPVLFFKATTALSGPDDDVVLPRGSSKTDWEVELAVVIGREGKRIRRDNAWDYIAGYTVMNDVSGREAQFGDGQWFRGKSFDSFAPLGPVLVTPDEIDDITNLTLTARVDGAVMQTGSTGDLVFDIPHLLAYISEDITLVPGDIISTGTPAGVGIFRDPPITLAAGNVVTCRIDGIGELVNPVVAAV